MFGHRNALALFCCESFLSLNYIGLLDICLVLSLDYIDHLIEIYLPVAHFSHVWSGETVVIMTANDVQYSNRVHIQKCFAVSKCQIKVRSGQGCIV